MKVSRTWPVEIYSWPPAVGMTTTRSDCAVVATVREGAVVEFLSRGMVPLIAGTRATAMQARMAMLGRWVVKSVGSL